MSTLKMKTLARLVKALEAGDLTEAGLNRLCERPYLVSPLYADLREIWSVTTTPYVDVAPLIWGNMKAVSFVERRETPHRPGEFICSRGDVPSQDEYVGSTKSIKGLLQVHQDKRPWYWQENTAPVYPLVRSKDREGSIFVKDVYQLDQWEIIAIVHVGEEWVLFRNGRECLSQTKEIETIQHGNSLFIFGEKVRQLTPKGMYEIEDAKDHDVIRWPTVSVNGSVIFRTAKGKKLFWDGNHWFPCGDPEHHYGAHGFFEDGTPYGVCLEHERLYTSNGEALSLSMKGVDSVTAWSHEGPFLCALNLEAERGLQGLTLIDAWEKTSGRAFGKIFFNQWYRARASSDGLFAVHAYWEDTNMWAVRTFNTVNESMGKRTPRWHVRQGNAHCLTISADGKHIAWVQSFKRKERFMEVTFSCVVVNGHSGRYHQGEIERLVWDTTRDQKTCLRYAVRDPWQNGKETLRGYEAVLNDE